MIEEVYRHIAEHRDNPVFIHVVPKEEALAAVRAAKGPLAGVPFAVKVWELGASEFGTFVAQIPPPLGIGTVELENGERVRGFLCEPYAVRRRPDITQLGGWRAYLEERRG